MPSVPTFSYEGKDFYGCPKRAVGTAARFMLQLFPHYKNGILWHSGGLADQPYVYVQAMALIGAEVAAVEAEWAEEQKRAAARPSVPRR